MDGDDVTIGIVNPDGSRAEMSGNGTRIAAAWLMERTGSTEARVHVGPRDRRGAASGAGLYESELGPVEVGQPERVDGIELTVVSVGNPHAVVVGDPSRIGELGPQLEGHRRFPGADERASGARRAAGRGHSARLGTGRGGDDSVRNERRGGRGRNAR